MLLAHNVVRTPIIMRHERRVHTSARRVQHPHGRTTRHCNPAAATRAAIQVMACTLHRPQNGIIVRKDSCAYRVPPVTPPGPQVRTGSHKRTWCRVQPRAARSFLPERSKSTLRTSQIAYNGIIVRSSPHAHHVPPVTHPVPQVRTACHLKPWRRTERQPTRGLLPERMCTM